MSFVIITPPGAAVSVEEMKRRLRVDHDDDDDEIEGLIDAAQAGFESPEIGWLRRPVALQEVEFYRNCFDHEIDLSGPVTIGGSKTFSVRYSNSAGADTLLASDQYRLDRAAGASPVLMPNSSWPYGTNIRVRCWVGFPEGDRRLGNFIAAIKLHVQMNYDDVDNAQAYRDSIDALLSAYRYRSF